MKVAEADGQVVVTGNIKSSHFTIKASRKAFEVLSSGIYSDKIRAVIRELSTNAADSHRAAKQDKPFIVHLPNRLEPYFSVKDFGTGLSPKLIRELYTEYFGSNRTDSNDFTGCLGLGSKSPFAYTDQFSVESRYKGTKYTYSCFINQEGMPDIAPLGDVKTDEPDGLEVKLSAKDTDYTEFKDKAIAVLSWFDPKPEVVGNSGFAFTERKYVKKTDTYGLVENRRNYYSEDHRSYVVMGNVAYPITLGDLTLTLSQTTLVDAGIDLFVGIGDVEIAASREKLGHTPAVNKAICAKLDEVVEWCKLEAVNIISTNKTLWEARQALHQFRSSVIGQFLPKYIAWNNQILSDEVHLNDYKDCPTLELVQPGREHWRRNSTRSAPTHYNTDRIIANNKSIFVDDLGAGVYSRVGHYLSEHHMSEGYLIGKDVVNTSSTSKVDFKDCGVYDVAIKVSTLPVPPASASTRAKEETSTLLKLNEVWGNDDKANWDIQKGVKLKTGGVYITISHFRPMDNHKYDRWRNARQLQTLLELITKIDKAFVLYGVRPADCARLLDKHAKKWTELTDYANEIATKYKKYLSGAQSLWFYNGYEYRGECKAFFAKRFSQDSVFGKYIRFIKEHHDASLPLEVIDYARLLEHLKQHNVLDKTLIEAERLKQAAFAKYPLLEHLNWHWVEGAGCVEPISQYIKAIDKEG